MMTSPMRQRGMTTIAVVMVIAMVAVFALFGLKVYPIYYDSFKVSSALRSMKTESGLVSKSSAEIVDQLMRRLKIDNMNSLEKSDVTVSKAGSVLTVSVDYEVRTSLVGNIDIVVHFEKEVEIGN